MKMTYNEMELEIIKFNSKDIITTSGGTNAEEPVTEGYPIT